MFLLGCLHRLQTSTLEIAKHFFDHSENRDVWDPSRKWLAGLPLAAFLTTMNPPIGLYAYHYQPNHNKQRWSHARIPNKNNKKIYLGPRLPWILATLTFSCELKPHSHIDFFGNHISTYFGLPKRTQHQTHQPPPRPSSEASVMTGEALPNSTSIKSNIERKKGHSSSGSSLRLTRRWVAKRSCVGFGWLFCFFCGTS